MTGCSRCRESSGTWLRDAGSPSTTRICSVAIASWTADARRAWSGGVDASDSVDGVRLFGPFVGTVSLHAREPQREAPGVLRACLHIVECNLDHELGANVDGPIVAADFTREKFLRLPGEHLVRHALERLAEHDKLARRRIARTEVEVREPAPAAAVTPFRGQHHQIERAGGLDLEPRSAAIARFVGRIERFGHHALVSAGERGLDEQLRFGGTAGDEPWNEKSSRQHRAQRREALACRPLGEHGVVEPKSVEEERRKRQLIAQRRHIELAAEAAHRGLERPRRYDGIERARLSVLYQTNTRQGV